MIIICTILSNVCAIYGNNGRGGGVSDYFGIKGLVSGFLEEISTLWLGICCGR